MRFMVSAFVALAIAPSVAAQDLPAVTRGLKYASSSCSDCHAVAAGQRVSPNPNAPTFESVANTPGMTEMALNVWLHTSHPSMPNLIIKPDRIDDLAAYIRTLKKKQ